MRFSKKAGRGTALVALAATSTLFAAGCSAGSLGSSAGGEGSAGAVTINYLLSGSGDDVVASAKSMVEAFQAANKGMRPNFMAVGGYDGMRVIYKALEASKGAGGDALLAAMKGQVFESPRGPVLIDAQTRDIVQDVYIRKVERVNGQLYNVEFDVQKAVKDPGKLK